MNLQTMFLWASRKQMGQKNGGAANYYTILYTITPYFNFAIFLLLLGANLGDKNPLSEPPKFYHVASKPSFDL